MINNLLPILLCSLIGLIIPVVFVYLDLSELEMAFNLKNFLWDIESQRILKFSLPAFPALFAIAGYLYVREKELIKRLNKNEADEKRNQHLAAIGEMTSSVAHEINNPLAIINGTTLILKRMIDKDHTKEELKEKIDQISGTCKRISAIVRTMQDITRDTTNEEPSQTSLKEVIGDIVEVFEEKVKGTEIKLDLDLDSEVSMTPILVKRISLSRVFINLINNSIDAVADSPAPWIKVSAEFKKNVLKVFIEDSGLGISEEVAERVFEPFYTSKDIGKGTGLGLSISAKVVRDEGGDIYIDQSKKNTTFVVEIPHKKTA
ncbi:MAG: C4-dicarboxylate-specific signal transduction histidine kinase [Bacteriovoracaceae bacterium]|jgi:C4-dicarboxylate-specific signal transduction histidine kinase